LIRITELSLPLDHPDDALRKAIVRRLGIPDADLPHVFERFYRADVARSRERGGSGLGLAITEFLVTAHGGTVSVGAVSRRWGTKPASLM